MNDRFAGLIATYLAEAVEVGEIAPLDTEVVAHAWMGAIYSLVIRWVYTGEPSSERIVQALVPMLLQSVGYSVASNGERVGQNGQGANRDNSTTATD